MSNNNPLQQFYRKETLYVALPSGGNYYGDEVVELTEDGEVGVRPMTAADEVMFKNPDALLNGTAIQDVVKSCVPAVKDVSKLLSNDIDTLVVAIRHASYGDKLDLSANCPECQAENEFELSMDQTLSSSVLLDDSYPVNLTSGLTAFIRPYNFAESLKAIRKAFEQNNLMRNYESEQFTEEQKLKIIGSSVTALSALSFELVAHCITKIYKEGESEEDTIEVTDPKHIEEFVDNASREDITRLQNVIDKINKIGIKKEFSATCEKCNHEWEVPIDFNPATFFTESL